VLHVLTTGERQGYYLDYPDPVGALARCLTEGFAYQGEHSAYRGRSRGEKSADVPLTAFVSFVQNHDQVGNRAFGERLTTLAPAPAVKAVTALVLLAPSPPLMFMGDEWAAVQPFLFFCDFGPDLAGKVREGRRREFAHLPEFRDATTNVPIPDPQDEQTVRRSTLDWSSLSHPEHRRRRQWTRRLLRLREQEIVPLLALGPFRARVTLFGATGLSVEWTCAEGTVLRLVSNLGPRPLPRPAGLDTAGRRLVAVSVGSTVERVLGAWHVAYYLAEER
jgi:maltooligosyltrehalose trehalohydrolase